MTSSKLGRLCIVLAIGAGIVFIPFHVMKLISPLPSYTDAADYIMTWIGGAGVTVLTISIGRVLFKLFFYIKDGSHPLK